MQPISGPPGMQGEPGPNVSAEYDRSLSKLPVTTEVIYLGLECVGVA